MPGLTPDQIEQKLSQLQAPQQDAFLESLSDPELEAYSKFSVGARPEATNPTTKLKDGRAVVMRPETKFEDQPDEVLEAIAAGDLDPDEEITTNLDQGPKGFFDTGMGGVLGSTIRNLGAVPALVGGGAMSAMTGDMDPLRAALAAPGMATDAMGMPRGDDSLDRLIFEGVGGAAGAGAPAGMLSRALLARGGGGGVGAAMAARPGAQAFAGGTGATAAQATAEGGGDSNEQLAAALMGGMTPGLARWGRSNSMRRFMRDDPAKVQSRIDTFDQAGAGTPTVAQATEGPGANSLEAMLSKFYPSSRKMQGKVQEQEKLIGEGLVRRAEALGPEQYNSDMGKRILSESEGTMVAARKIQDGLYDDFHAKLPRGTVVPTTNFGRTVDELAAHVPGAKNLSGNKFLNPDQASYQNLLADLKKDVLANQGAGVPYEALKKIRSRVGDMIEEATFSQNPRTGELKRLYGSLSEDMKLAADGAGTPARKAFDKANAAVQQWHELLDTVRPILDRHGGGEAVFKSALSGLNEGGTVIRSVYHMMKPEARKLMTAQILRRMAGDTEDFNMFTLFKKYDKMDKEAREVVFGPMGNNYKGDMDAIAESVRTINKQKENYGLATNPKEGIMGFHYLLGAATSAPIGMMIGASAGSTTGTAIGASILGGALLTAYGSRKAANFMTNPKTVKWLAETTKLPAEQLPIAINQLWQQARRDNDPELQAFAEALKSQMEQP